jgi:hypothetical protein
MYSGTIARKILAQHLIIEGATGPCLSGGEGKHHCTGHGRPGNAKWAGTQWR